MENYGLDQRIFVAGHQGMVGSAILRQLRNHGYRNIVLRSHSELDLSRQTEVERFFENEEIDIVYLAAAKVGGIYSNNAFPAEFIYQNLMIECNTIDAAHRAGIDRLIFLGSSCIYPKYAAQPITEASLLTGALESSNEPYAIAKIAGIKMCESYNRQYGRDYRVIMPTSLYGPFDNFHPENSHVIPGMFRRFRQAIQTGNDVVIWGTGLPMREFMHVDDMANATVYLAQIEQPIYRNVVQQTCSHINVGTGMDCSIRDLAELIGRTSGFQGKVIYDITKPDGTPRKLLDVSRLNALGWNASIRLEDGIKQAYQWFLENHVEPAF